MRWRSKREKETFEKDVREIEEREFGAGVRSERGGKEKTSDEGERKKTSAVWNPGESEGKSSEWYKEGGRGDFHLIHV